MLSERNLTFQGANILVLFGEGGGLGGYSCLQHLYVRPKSRTIIVYLCKQLQIKLHMKTS
jgi:hypothetical protein